MASTVFRTTEYNITYDVGTAVQESTRNAFRVRNNTTNFYIRILISNPFWITMDANQVVLGPRAEWQTNIIALEENINQLIINNVKNISDLISITIQPIEVTGPIFVQSNLDPLLIQ